MGETRAGDVQTQRSARLAEFESVAPEHEFSALSAAWNTRGTELHARIWRECLLGPVTRVYRLLSPAERANAAAIVLAFAERFVAAHLIPVDERRALDLLAAGAAPDDGPPAITAELNAVRATGRKLVFQGSLTNRMTGPGRLVAHSRGRIAGIRLPLGSVTLADGTFTATLDESDLRPFGRWSLSLETESGSAPLRLVTPVDSRAIPRTRRIWSVGRVGEPLTVETRGSVPQRLSLALETRARASRPRIVPRALYRIAGRASRSARAASTRSRNASDIARGG
jgi:hypothetical protein